jgi:hypothetical protein
MVVQFGARRRLLSCAVIVASVAIGGLVAAGIASGAIAAKPSMEVLPSAHGLKYSQTVEIKGHYLPKGSGTVAATICGLQDDSGKNLSKPGANDCAGASEVGSLVQVRQWQSNGEFDTKYTLPKSGERFGQNKRFCDKTHHCALVVADANPNNPAYYISTVIQFVDQQPFGTTTPTTKPKAKSTPTTTKKTSATSAPTTTPTSSTGATMSGSGSGSMGQSSASMHASASVSVTPPSGGPTLPTLPPLTTPAPGSNPIPPQVATALNQACSQLAAAVKQGGGDPTALLAACSALTSGNGASELALVLQNPSLLCVEGQSAWQNNQQITQACEQAATALGPVTSAIGSGLGPVLANP